MYREFLTCFAMVVGGCEGRSVEQHSSSVADSILSNESGTLDIGDAQAIEQALIAYVSECNSRASQALSLRNRAISLEAIGYDVVETDSALKPFAGVVTVDYVYESVGGERRHYKWDVKLKPSEDGAFDFLSCYGGPMQAGGKHSDWTLSELAFQGPILQFLFGIGTGGELADRVIRERFPNAGN